MDLLDEIIEDVELRRESVSSVAYVTDSALALYSAARQTRAIERLVELIEQEVDDVRDDEY